MLTAEERNKLRHVDVRAEFHAAHNTWGIGGEDIMLIFKWAKELGIKFSANNLIEGDTVYVDLSIENAIEFRNKLDAAIADAQRIDREYAESEGT
jgi:hypothetical protein